MRSFRALVARMSSSTFTFNARASRLDGCSMANTITNVTRVATDATSPSRLVIKPRAVAAHTRTAAIAKAFSSPSASVSWSMSRLVRGRRRRGVARWGLAGSLIGFAPGRSAFQRPSRRVVEWREIEGDQVSNALVAGDRRVAEAFDERACHGRVDGRHELEPERRERRCEHRHLNDSRPPAEECGD